MIEQIVTYYNEHRWKSLFFITCFGFILIVFSQLFPMMKDILSLHQQIRSNQLKLDNINQWQSQYNEALINKKKLKKHIENFYIANDQDSRVSRMIAFLSEKAKSNQVQIISIRPEDSHFNDQYIELPIHLMLFSKYHKIGQFVNSIETSTSIVKVQNLNFKSDKITSDAITAELELLFYFLKSEK